MPFFSSKRVLGIDVGSFSIKIAEISSKGESFYLENYAFLESSFLYYNPFRSLKERSFSLSTKDTAQALKEMIAEAKFKSKVASFAIPDFTSFFTTFTLPPMSREELHSAVKFEARKYIPLPIREMALDWLPVGGLKEGGHEQVRILLSAVPKRIVEQYQEMAYLAGLDLKSVEVEVFSIVRALVDRESSQTLAIIDLGYKTTTCTIVDLGVPKISHSFSIGGEELTKALKTNLGLDVETAERLKSKYGILEKGEVIREVLLQVVDSIIIEIEKTLQHLYQLEQKSVDKVILIGGGANLPGLREYLASKLSKVVEVGDSFRKVKVPSKLEGVLRDLSIIFAPAIGTALGQLQN